jgi:hypothetical protein
MPVDELVAKAVAALRHPALPASLFRQELSSFATKPEVQGLQSLLESTPIFNSVFCQEFCKRILDLDELKDTSLYHLAESFSSGPQGHELACLVAFLTEFYNVEVLFDHESGAEPPMPETVLLRIRDGSKNHAQLESVFGIAMARDKIAERCALVLRLLDHIATDSESFEVKNSKYFSILSSLASLNHLSVKQVSVRAKEILVRSRVQRLEERMEYVGNVLHQSLQGDQRPIDLSILKALVDSNYTVSYLL